MKDPSFYPYATAKGYMQSVYLIMTNKDRFQLDDDTTFYMSFHMLCGFALELYLKSILIYLGCSEAELKKPDVRHNLIKLNDMCKEKGFISKSAEYLSKLFSKHHKEFGFRYIKPGNEYDRTSPSRIFKAFSSLNREIDNKIGASASKGLKSEGEWRLPPGTAHWRF